VLTAEAVERLDMIDEEFTRQAGVDPSGWAAIKGRGFWHIVKLSGLYALGRAGHQAEVELIDVLRACHLVETTLADLGQMQEEVGANALERQVHEVLDLLGAAKTGRLKTSHIARRLKLTSRDMRELAGTLLIRDLVAIEGEHPDTYWRKK
jgi:hypothetical protein